MTGNLLWSRSALVLSNSQCPLYSEVAKYSASLLIKLSFVVRCRETRSPCSVQLCRIISMQTLLPQLGQSHTPIYPFTKTNYFFNPKVHLIPPPSDWRGEDRGSAEGEQWVLLALWSSEYRRSRAVLFVTANWRPFASMDCLGGGCWASWQLLCLSTLPDVKGFLSKESNVSAFSLSQRRRGNRSTVRLMLSNEETLYMNVLSFLRVPLFHDSIQEAFCIAELYCKTMGQQLIEHIKFSLLVCVSSWRNHSQWQCSYACMSSHKCHLMSLRLHPHDVDVGFRLRRALPERECVPVETPGSESKGSPCYHASSNDALFATPQMRLINKSLQWSGTSIKPMTGHLQV